MSTPDEPRYGRVAQVTRMNPQLVRIVFGGPGLSGVAGPWALAARPGDLLQLRGPPGPTSPAARPTGTCRRATRARWAWPRQELSLSPYWRRTYTDERWRELKKDWPR